MANEELMISRSNLVPVEKELSETKPSSSFVSKLKEAAGNARDVLIAMTGGHKADIKPQGLTPHQEALAKNIGGTVGGKK